MLVLVKSHVVVVVVVEIVVYTQRVLCSIP
jgi:hypothetical protein